MLLGKTKVTASGKGSGLFLFLAVIGFQSLCIYGTTATKRLYNDLLYESGYNRHIRPVENEEDQLSVDMSVKLGQIIDVDEKNQVMTTNLWVLLRWTDLKLSWKPEDYNNTTKLWVPAEYVWQPDIVLFNNADGKYEMTADTKVTIDYDGTVSWEPPAIFKSGCNIDVTYFPFDEQNCTLEFGSWTYNIAEVEINHTGQVGQDSVVEQGIDLRVFYHGVEWDLVAVPAIRSYIHYAGSPDKFRLWTFVIVLKRRFLYYTINLIIPLVSHAFITLLVFYLPADSKQKIALCITVFFSLIVFFLMLAEIIPPSSIVVPLLGKYLVFTMMLVVISVFTTVITYNFHYRSAATCTMGSWTKKVFLYWLPRLLKMRRPKVENSHDVELKQIKLRFCSCCREEEEDAQVMVDNSPGPSFTKPPLVSWLKGKLAKSGADRHNLRTYQFGSKRTMTQTELMTLSRELDESSLVGQVPGNNAVLQDAIDGAIYIANHLRQEDEFKRTQEDWKYVALVMDRCLLCIYVLICLFGSIGIICQAPILYDTRTAVEINETQSVNISDTGFIKFCEQVYSGEMYHTPKFLDFCENSLCDILGKCFHEH